MMRANSFRVRQQAVVINSEHEVLLLQYPTNSKEANKWDLVGGHLEEEENWEKGILREIKEETGLDVKIKGPFRVFSHKSTYIVFFAAEAQSTEVNLSSEHTAYGWFSLENIEKLDVVRPNLIEDIQSALRLSAIL